MAEMSIIASALQIADIGIRLSLRLYTFGETVASADKSIISISENVSLTSTVLKELGQTLDKDRTTRICSPNAMRTADNIVKQCQRIFQEMDHILVKKFARIKSAEKDKKIKSAQTLERLRWPFIKGKIELLTSDLERQKSTLVLMLNVIALAKQEFEKTEASTTIAEQRSLIQDLARSNEGYLHKFEQLRLSCPDVPMNQDVISADCNDSIPTLRAPTLQGFARPSALGAASQRGLTTGAQDFRSESYQGSYTFVPPPVGISYVQQQYDNLLRTLLKEVSEPKYEIAEESRSRIKADIVTSHEREMRPTEQQTPTTNPVALNSWRPRADKPELKSVHLKYPNRLEEKFVGDATRSEEEDDRPTQLKVKYVGDMTRSEEEDDRPARPEEIILDNATRSEEENDRPIQLKAKYVGDMTRSAEEDDYPTQPEDQYPQIAPTRKRKAPDIPSRSFKIPNLVKEFSKPRTRPPLHRLCKKLMRFDSDKTEDSAENVVDTLLATWTTLPMRVGTH